MSAHAATLKLERAGDAELVTMTRKGNADAYATLFRRHATAAASVARSVTSTYEPDDLVSEAYTRILQALKAGNGPTAAFRPYLFTTVRNIAASWGRSGKDALPLEPEELDTLAVQEDDTLVVLDRSLTAQAFRSLPSRWQEALWYSEVEGMQPAELAPLLGMRASAAAALCYRAREGLRQAWIRAHLTSAELEPECAWTVERLAAHARGRLGKRDNARVEAHLDSCAKCTIAAEEAADTGARLALVLLPLILGTAAAATYGASVNAGAVSGATAAGLGALGAGAANASGAAAGAAATSGTAAGGAAGGGAGGSAGGAGAAGGSASTGGAMTGTTGLLIGVAAGIVVVAGAVAGIVIATAPGHSSDASPTVQSGTFGSTGSSPAPTAAPTPSPSPSKRALPPAAPASSPAPIAAPAPVNTPVAPGATPTPTSTPTPPPVVAPAAPTITIDTGDGRYLPIVSGTALPGATVTVTGGGASTTVSVGAQGDWQVTAPGDYGAGEYTVTAAQTDANGGTSATASATFSLTAPQLTVNGVGGSNSPMLTVRATGTVGASVELIVDGVSQGIRTLNGSGKYNYIVLVGQGTHDIAVRYADDSGRLGVETQVSVTVGA